MRRLGLGVAALLFAAGCDTGGTSDTDISMKFDAGPDSGAVVIFEDGGVPATPPDGVAACPQGICNYQSGTGCPASTPACVPIPNNGTIAPACSPAGAGKTGSSCAQQTDCAAGYFCVTNEGQCRKLCCGGDWTGCDSAGEHCLKSLDYGDGMGGVQSTGAMLCYPINTCDALKPASCTQAGTECIVADATGATACLPPGPGGAGEACPCKGGFVCVSDAPDASPTCHRLCGAVPGGAPPYCQEGEGVCVHHLRDPDGVGECLKL
ncbi:MAG: hypothetical protein QM820_50215 [Minicystis sp.]